MSVIVTDTGFSPATQVEVVALADLTTQTAVDLSNTDDPLALQDDLRQAARMLGQRDGRFVAGFVLGLARSTDDPALASAATDLGPQGQGMARLRQMIASRLSAMGDGVVPPQPGVQAP